MKFVESEKSTKQMELPREVLIGRGVLDNVPEVCKRIWGTFSEKGFSAMVVADEFTMKIAGERVLDALNDGDIPAEPIIINKATPDDVNMVVDAGSTSKPNFLIGVGGGGVIDVAKLASVRLGCSFLSVPTVASHDGVVSSRASIRDGKSVTSIEAHPPIGVVADTEIITGAPYRFLAAGCGDIISNKTAVLDWKLSHRLRGEPYSHYASTLSEMSATIIMDAADTIKPNLEDSARIVMKALVSSGVAMSIAGSSRPASGSEHKFSHTLDMIAEKPALHGEQCGVGSIMMMYLHGGDWMSIRDALKTVGAPTTAKELGIPEETIVEALLKAREVRPERYTIIDAGLTREGAYALAEFTGVI
ncbi:MAG: NAD(P)-dependent glycerol-1-phosphate dehydrogenase [Methermicoccaceae archaeon]